MGQSTTDRGKYGEQRAAEHLRQRGWEILERNFRLFGAEVDIIAKCRDEYHFVEVKSWRTIDRSDIEYAIDRRKRARIARVASGYLASLTMSEMPTVHFDVIFVDPDKLEVYAIDDAFYME
mgnify:CR=1 FL=1